jgi:chromosome partitioning protein
MDMTTDQEDTTSGSPTAPPAADIAATAAERGSDQPAVSSPPSSIANPTVERPEAAAKPPEGASPAALDAEAGTAQAASLDGGAAIGTSDRAAGASASGAASGILGSSDRGSSEAPDVRPQVHVDPPPLGPLGEQAGDQEAADPPGPLDAEMASEPSGGDRGQTGPSYHGAGPAGGMAGAPLGDQPSVAAPTSGSTADRGSGPAGPPSEAAAADAGSRETPHRSAPDVGWFSTASRPGHYTGALSAQLSAERPGEELAHRPTEAPQPPPDSSDPQSVAHHPNRLLGPVRQSDASAEGPARVGEAGAVDLSGAHDATTTGGPTSPGLPSGGRVVPGGPDGAEAGEPARAEQSSGVRGSSGPGEVPSAATPAGTGLAAGSGDLRGPELIESGMVYVDPDPEIGSPPRAAGWSGQPAARPEPMEGFGDRSETAGRPEGTTPEHSRARADTISPVPGLDATTGGAGAEAGAGPVSREAGEEPDEAQTAMPTDAAANAVHGLDPHAVPWNEPALPMALPPGMASPDRGSPLDEEALDDDLMPKPDPTWPRLFGTNTKTETPDPSEPGDAPRPQDEPAVPVHRATGDERVEARREYSDGERQEGAPDPERGAPPVGSHQAVVDVTTAEPPIGGEPPTQPGLGRRPGAISGPAAEVGTDGAGDSNPSTVTRQAEAGQVDLRDMATSPRSVDVSRETSAGGDEGMNQELDDEAVEDEAAVAVREAVSRAAAEAGVDVSRETSAIAPGTPIGELTAEPSVDREAAARSARVTFRIHRETLNGDRRVLAVANQKGGVGKSTTAVNIGAYLALAGARVLVVDLDPQGNASTGLGLDHRQIEPSIYDVLTGETPPATAIRATGVADLHILPSTIDLAGAEVELVSAMSRETRLRRALESIDHQYDTILIDCPPSLGLLTVNALAAADELLIPIQCEYYALEGLGQLLRNVELVRANLNPELRIGGIVLTMYDGRTRLALQVVDEVRKHFTDVVFQTVVPRSVRLSEAPGYGLPIALYDPLSRGGIAYRDLTFELAERSGLLAPTGEGAS